ncbi:hypothetical protein B0A48_08570 [Cryoendolithus antarcticus]|uniref:Uncharacterized protein n=1 Tax=Cryoendolithus antarcticus TaxID=1507870 RepID=A0A1V8T6I1_9PEZI|nr:hypothetical protein B0A48_08570 [Cryoendolithus antarcticus]
MAAKRIQDLAWWTMPLLILRVILLAGFVSLATAVPSNVTHALQSRVQVPAFEWTAWGDSFASGIGAGDLIEWGECWRGTGAYSQQLEAVPAGGKLPGAPENSEAQSLRVLWFHDGNSTGDTIPRGWSRPSHNGSALG